MKITFVYPRFEKFLKNNPDIDRGLIDYFLGDFTTPPSLGIPIMAAWTPKDIDIELVDDNSGDLVDFAADTDLVAINCFTPQATRAFELADGYRAQGKKVIMGGFFPSFMVDECLKHADAVNVGEVEPTWEKILADVRNGTLKRKYVGGSRFDLNKFKIPRREIFYNKHNYDWDEDLIQLTRGCTYNCAMCAIPAHMGHRIRFRPIPQVVEELKSLKYENVYLADDTLFFPHRRINTYARELFEAVRALGKKFFVSSTMALNIDKEFMKLAADAGVCNFYCTMNVDPLSIKALQGEQRERRLLCDLVKVLQDYGIRFFGSCALGRDWDDTSIADRILELFDEAGIHTSEFFLFTPYPGSVHWDRLERQGRIIDRNWSHYNGAHVVSKPLRMSVDDLQSQFIKVWNEFFRRQKSMHVAHLEPATYQEGRQVVGKPLVRKGVKNAAAITGIGVVSPIGNTTDEVLASLRSGASGIAAIAQFDARHFRTQLGGEIRKIDASAALTDEENQALDDRYLKLAVSSARYALHDAQLDIQSSAVKGQVALVLATCNGGLLSAQAEYSWKHGKSAVPFDEKMNLQAQYYGLGKALSWALDIPVETWIVTTACSSSTGALGIAQKLINKGYYEAVLVGGVDTLCLANMSGFNGLKATSTGRTAPFSLPVGLNIGEGACFWLVENMESALLRNARCYGKLIGHATSSDAYHPTSPDPRGQGVFRTLRNALDSAGLSLSEIGCINAHGTGTEANDRAETRGISKLIGEKPVPVVSTKSFFGHCMGVTGILEATCNLLSMNAGFIPPTINFTTQRPGCTLDYVPNSPRTGSYRVFISANYAFGGNNAATVISTWDYEAPPRTAPDERVVITGTGVVTSLGYGSSYLLQALRDNRVGMRDVSSLNLKGIASRYAGLVEDLRLKDLDRRLAVEDLNKISTFAVAAAHLALKDAGLRVSPKNAEHVGIAMGVCNGSCEMEHMDSVFSSATYEANINSFSNITANSTAGWVSNVLCLKGENTSLAPGHHAGLQAMAFAWEVLNDGRARSMLACASDEVYPQTFYNYDLIGYLYQGDDERTYRIHPDELRRKVLGEGAATLTMETLSCAQQRGAPVLAEVLGYAMGTDGCHFARQSLDTPRLKRVIEQALARSRISPEAIGLIIWAPQGNRQDLKVMEAVSALWPRASVRPPLVTTSFNTGYIETASILVSIAMVLESLKSGVELWPQRTGLDEIDSRRLSLVPEHCLAVGSSDVGYNFATVLKTGRDA
ncbi:MAG: radical SAM protein [Chitinivibrionales bacterium]|nr:radical SAM protein [Chitinivibrionales bacterium]